MPDRRKHRGPHPKDAVLFSEAWLPRLREAFHDLVYLLSRGYSATSALKLVGDRYQLHRRQRMALMRSACSDQALAHRLSTQVPLQQLSGMPLLIDGYNLLITLESALSGGWLFRGREGCLRDLSSMHGSYRKVEETLPALEHIGHWLHAHTSAPIRWLLDAPVSNSGRLRQLMRSCARTHGWLWEVELSPHVDHRLTTEREAIVVTTDGPVLDRVSRWANLTVPLVEQLPHARIVDFSDRNSTEATDSMK